MRTIIVLTGLLVSLGFAVNASAQPRFERCDRQRNEITELKSRLGDLDRQRNETIERIRVLESEVNRDCGASGGCEAFEDRISDLKRREVPLAEAMRRLRDMLRERVEETNRLNRDQDRIENAYRRDNCDNISNHAPRGTYERCSTLYNEWAGMENHISTHEREIANMRNRFEQELRQMDTIIDEISRLLGEMREHCSRHARFGEIESMERNWQQFRTLRADLDNIERSVKRYRDVHLVQPKNVIRQDDDRKHTIRPNH
jgi:chromosome segregation ATPase